MKLKKILSICLVGAMAATMLAACGSSDETVGEEIKDDVEEVAEDVKDGVEEAAEDVKDVAEDVGEGVVDAVEDVGEDVKDAAEEAVEDVKENAGGGSGFDGFDEMITITAMGITEYGTEGLEEVMDAINEISEAEINVHVDYTSIELGAYSEQVGLMLAGGEALDLCMVSPLASTRFTVMMGQNQLMDVSDLLEEYAPGILETMGVALDSMAVGDTQYAVPVYRNYGGNDYLVMRKDILDELGLTEQAQAMSSWSDAEEIFEAVYEAQDTLPTEMQTTCVIGSQDNTGCFITYPAYDNAAENFSDHYGFDNLGDTYKVIRTDENGVVSNAFANEDYLACLELMRKWYNNGWVYKDAATSVDAGDALMTNGVCFCYFVGSEIGVEAQKKKATGYDVICVNVCPGMVSTGSSTTWGWAVPVTATEPEAAVAFLGLMYTNVDVMNLFVYGIEGRDYELNDEGEAVILPDAVYQASDWMFGNQFLTYPSEGEGGDFRQVSLESLQSAVFSPYYGFTVDTDPIANELTALNNVVEQYNPGLQSGAVDPADSYDEFLSALDSAGMQIVLDYYQEALDEWVAEQ